MLARPEPIDVIALLPDDAPRMFVWRRKRYRVTQGDGPERLHGEWWRSEEHTSELQSLMRISYAVFCLKKKKNKKKHRKMNTDTNHNLYDHTRKYKQRSIINEKYA